MGINDEAFRLGWAAHRDNLWGQYSQAIDSTSRGDTYAAAWLTGWDRFRK